MRAIRVILIVIGAAALSGLLPAVATAQAWGQPSHNAPAVTWGQGGGAWRSGLTEWHDRAYAVTGEAATGYVNAPAPAYGGDLNRGVGYGDPRAYRAPGQAAHGDGYGEVYPRRDRGGRYGYSVADRWTRWSTPPGRGYHDVYGYNDDRAPRAAESAHHHHDACPCDVGPYLYDR